LSTLSKIPKDLVILVCDSRKALILKNAGSPMQPELEITEHFEPADDLIGNIDSDRPGRRPDAGHSQTGNRVRSAMHTTDTGKVQADAFAAQIVDHLVKQHHAKPIGQLALVAPPTFLGTLRDKMSNELRQLTTVELDKHLTELPVTDIQSSLMGSL